MKLFEISFPEASPFIKRWHYSGNVPRGRNIFFGWYLNHKLYAVSDYGNGVNPQQAEYLSKVTGENVTNTNSVELKRLCRTDPRIDEYPLTRFLSLCHKRLKKMGYKYIVSFSDPEYGHNGGIYKAANFKHLGLTDFEYHTIDKKGKKYHKLYAMRYAQRNGIKPKEAREKLGLTIRKTLPKDRWFLAL